MATRRNPFAIVTICLTLALVLWGYVTLTREYDDVISAPLVVKPQDQRALLSTVPKTVSVRVRGSGLQILNLRYFARTLACSLDLARLRPTSENTYAVSSEDLIRALVTPQTIRALSVDPSAITMTVGDMVSKRVTVRPRVECSARTGFELVGSPIVRPAEVEVRGSGAIVDNVASWSTSRLVLQDLRSSVDVDVAVSDSLTTLLNIVPSTVRITWPVQQSADITIDDVDVHLVEAGDKSWTVSPSRLRIVLAGGVDELARVTSRDVRVDVTPDNATPLVRPRVSVPSTLRVVTTYPQHVHVVRRQP